MTRQDASPKIMADLQSDRVHVAMTATKPRRIASLVSSATEILCALGLGHRLVAVSHECDYPPEVATKRRITRTHVDDSVSSRQIDDQVREASHRGAPLYSIDEAALSECAPDLIVTQQQCDVCAVNYDEVVEAVNRLDTDRSIPVVAVNPVSLNDVLEDILKIGRATESVAEAQELVHSLRGRISDVGQRTAALSASDRPRTIIIEWIEPLMLAANWVPEILQLAGGDCPLVHGGQHSLYVDWQAVVEFDPQCVIISPCGFDLTRTLREVRSLSDVTGWSQLSAVRNGRVFALDGNAYVSRSGPRLVDTLEILGHLLHPGLFAVPSAIESPGEAWRMV